MDKQAFKQRMQNLKSYRENNPGKGYWDWKVQSFENGGEVTRKSLKDIRKESTIGDKLDYDVMFKSLSAYTKWFNSIPLLGIGAIGVNKYFNNGTEQEK